MLSLPGTSIGIVQDRLSVIYKDFFVQLMILFINRVGINVVNDELNANLLAK